MVKKFTVFFSADMRAKLDDHQTRKDLAYVIDLPAAMFRNVISGGIFFSEEEARKVGGGAWKYFEVGHSEFGQLRDAVNRGYRAEAFISMVREDVLDVTFSFYEKSGKEPFWLCNLWVEIPSNVVVASSRKY